MSSSSSDHLSKHIKSVEDLDKVMEHLSQDSVWQTMDSTAKNTILKELHEDLVHDKLVEAAKKTLKGKPGRKKKEDKKEESSDKDES